ncbi:hypothetical protein [Aquariibacter albus]|uniref:Lipoprotein n=1 Tax=Aquariibacter albus TaxID=2759899 RepID=A0A839HS34_9BURK|nr:hypothetical protein [Aquariibacter albus]MBB1162428.1 hypothetical protein [Aquariibacter albus]
MNLKKILKVFFSMLLTGVGAAGCLSAQASQTQGVIKKIVTYPNEGRAVTFIASSLSNKPACNSTSGYAINLTTDAGRVIYNSLVEASTRKTTITIVGSGSCSLRAGSEDLISFETTPATEALPLDAIAICSNGTGGTQGKPGDCSCNTGKYIVPKQIAVTNCSITTSSGLSCSGHAFDGRPGACCLCAP